MLKVKTRFASHVLYFVSGPGNKTLLIKPGKVQDQVGLLS
jgi:hypothetical protein